MLTRGIDFCGALFGRCLRAAQRSVCDGGKRSIEVQPGGHVPALCSAESVPSSEPVFIYSGLQTYTNMDNSV